MTTDINIKKELALRDRKNLTRTLSMIPRPGAVFMDDSGREILNFSSNDYLNLSQEPSVIQRAKDALDTYGTGSTSSRLLSGTLPIHRELEEQLSHKKGTPAALVLGSGYLTNVAIVDSFTNKDSILIADKFIHACVLDGARMAGCPVRRFQHNDPDHLEALLNRHTGKDVLVAVESVYSMNGDCAPLPEIAELCRTYKARLLVDEAHATGIWGEAGAGRVNALGLEDSVPFIMGTLSKALGSYGGYVCCGELEKTWMVNQARSLIYTTALPPPAVGAALGALEFLEHHPELGKDLLEKSARFKLRIEAQGLSCGETETQIVPVQVETAENAVNLAEALRQRGIWVYAIRPPTVPRGQSCVRFSLCRGHSAQQLDDTADNIITCFKNL